MAQKEIVLNINLEAGDAIADLKALAVNTGELKDRKKELTDQIKAEEKALKETQKLYAQGKASSDELAAAESRLANVRKKNREEIALLDAALRGNSGRARELTNDISGLTDEGLRFRDKMAQAFADAIGPTFSRLSEAVGKANSEMANALKTFGAGSAEFKKAADGVQRLEAGFAELKAAQNEASTALKTFGENSKEFTEANERLKALEASAANLADEVAGKVEPKFEALNRQLREARKEAQAAAEEFGFASREFKAAADRADELDDQIKRVNVAIGAIDAEGKIETFGKALGGVAGAFSIAEGAAALFGKENENVQQALLKVQAALAIQQGISGLIEGAKAAKGLAVTLGLVGPAAEGGAAGMRALSAASITTGIGAIVAAVGLLAAGFIALSNTIDNSKKKTEDLIKTQEELNRLKGEASQRALSAELALQVELGKITQAEAQRKQAIVDRGKELTEQSKRRADAEREVADAAKALLEAKTAEVASGKLSIAGATGLVEKESERLRVARENLKAVDEIAVKTASAFSAEIQLSKIQENKAKATEEQGKQQEKITTSVERQAVAQEKTVQLSQAELDIIQKRAEAEQEARDTTKANEYYTELEQITNEYYDSLLTDVQRAENAEREKFFKLITQTQESADQQKAIAEQLAKDLEAARRSAAGTAGGDPAAGEQEVADAELAVLEQKYADAIAKLEEFNDNEALLVTAQLERIEDIRAEFAAKEEERKKTETTTTKKKTDVEIESEEKRIESLQASADALVAFSAVAEQQSVAQKALAISGALINTYLGATKALTDTTIPNTFARIAAAVAVVASGLASVAKMRGFADGGYTGGGGKYEPAGIVHRGEYVLPQEVVRAIGVPRLDALRSMFTDAAPGRGRYATGGLVTPTLPASSIFAADQAAAMTTMQLQPVLPVESLRAVQNRVAVRESRSSL
jgi:hypothetical protein